MNITILLTIFLVIAVCLETAHGESNTKLRTHETHRSLRADSPFIKFVKEFFKRIGIFTSNVGGAFKHLFTGQKPGASQDADSVDTSDIEDNISATSATQPSHTQHSNAQADDSNVGLLIRQEVRREALHHLERQQTGPPRNSNRIVTNKNLVRAAIPVAAKALPHIAKFFAKAMANRGNGGGHGKSDSYDSASVEETLLSI